MAAPQRQQLGAEEALRKDLEAHNDHQQVISTLLLTCLCYITLLSIDFWRRKLESEISDNMDRWKGRGGRGEGSEKRKAKERNLEKRKSQKKEDAGALKGRKVAIQFF